MSVKIISQNKNVAADLTAAVKLDCTLNSIDRTYKLANSS
jgi:hypothetical protein